MAEFPALPIWTDAILADCGYMSDEKFGAYHRLLYLIWRSPNCRIPNDDAWLAERLAKPIEVIRSIYRQFVTTDVCDCAEVLCRTDGKWIFQKRLTQEKKYLQSNSRKQSERAKSRWNKEKPICRGNAASGNAPTPTPTPLTIEEESSIVTPAKEQLDAKPKRTRKQSFHIADDFQADFGSLALASELGIDAGQTTREFIDYWKSVGKPMCDWQAAFRNRLRQISKHRNERAARDIAGRQNVRDVTGAALRAVEARREAINQA